MRKAELVALAGSAGAQGVYLAWPDTSTRGDGDGGGGGDAGSGEVTVHTRFFNPGVGLDEDPATGSAAGPLAALLCDHGLLGPGERLTVFQGASMGRPGACPRSGVVRPKGVARGVWCVRSQGGGPSVYWMYSLGPT
ncbi:PhzF family phenazine biosynthesis protein, partial [Streptomyces sp. NPDC087420]|uniref:PhzF family phenazine biosynthesis protein n=1 Tax=Streptomyces sp. NPDC087420 TaxID=3365785 RepID=UPI003835EC15